MPEVYPQRGTPPAKDRVVQALRTSQDRCCDVRAGQDMESPLTSVTDILRRAIDGVVDAGSDQNLHLIERFTRTGPDTIVYRFTIDDPTAFTKPWTGEIVMVKIEGPLYEYACHEGNYSMTNMLRAARAAEKAGQSK